MNHYSHFTLKERELLKHYVDISLNQSEIAIKLGRNKSYEERRGKIQITNPISERPDAAEKRQRLGDWEADTVAGNIGRTCLLTLKCTHSKKSG